MYSTIYPLNFPSARINDWIRPLKVKDKYGLKKDSYILYLARIVPEKRLDLLIDAFKNVKTDKKLVIAGGSSHTNDFLDEIKEKAKQDDRIIMTGFVQGEELEELFSNTYLYCLPSDVEGMPISLMEAMSYGANVLTSDIEECIQVSEKYGYSFKKSNISDLKQKIEIMCRSNLIDSNEISKYICNRFNWNNTVNETIKLYEKVKIKKWKLY